MSIPFPANPVVWAAIDSYMKRAYDGMPPASVRVRLDVLHSQPPEVFQECKVFEKDTHLPPNRYSLRLGNRAYPHMKLTIERINEDSDFFFKADTHDRHCCPRPESPEYHAFLSLMEANEALSKQIESEWVAAGIPTFREFLRDDLARRQNATRTSA